MINNKTRRLEKEKTLTRERLKELLWYNPYTGLFFWQVHHPRTRVTAGDIAGCIHRTHRYICIKIDKKLYMAHRLVFLYMTGKWPKDQVDHINRNRKDNRWCNLREATNQQNAANRRAHPTNRIGLKGVILSSNGKYIGQIKVNQKTKQLGSFDTPEEAHDAYCKAAKEAFGEYARNK